MHPHAAVSHGLAAMPVLLYNKLSLSIWLWHPALSAYLALALGCKRKQGSAELCPHQLALALARCGPSKKVLQIT